MSKQPLTIASDSDASTSRTSASGATFHVPVLA